MSLNIKKPLNTKISLNIKKSLNIKLSLNIKKSLNIKSSPKINIEFCTIGSFPNSVFVSLGCALK